MVSVITFFVVSLVAIVQVMQSAAAPQTRLPACSEVTTLTPLNSSPLQEFAKADDGPKFLSSKDDFDATIVNTEKSSVVQGLITTIETKNVDESHSLTRIYWNIEEGNIASRYFKLSSNQKCRVTKSAQYGSLKEVTYYQQH